MAGIFLSHRSADSGWAVLLDRELSRHFGKDHIFRASRSIRPGQDFADRILEAVCTSWIVLALIGVDWATATDANGSRKLDNQDDWVRQEIAHAFQTGVLVVPVLLDDAPPPATANLPPDLARLGRCQYLRLHHQNDQYDINRLIFELAELATCHRAGPPFEDGRQVRRAVTGTSATASIPEGRSADQP